MTDEYPRFKCAGCGKITVDAESLIAECSCGCDRVQLRHWPNGGEDWEAPEWPEWSEYSPDPFENENVIVYEGKNSVYKEPANAGKVDHE